MLDELLEFGASFDVFGPVVATLRNLANGGGYTFLIPYNQSPLSGAEIQAMLRGHGVKSWGAMVIAGTLTLSVKPSAAKYAQHLLEKAGIPTENAAPRGSTTARTPAPSPSQRRAHLTARARRLATLERGR